MNHNIIINILKECRSSGPIRDCLGRKRLTYYQQAMGQEDPGINDLQASLIDSEESLNPYSDVISSPNKQGQRTSTAIYAEGRIREINLQVENFLGVFAEDIKDILETLHSPHETNIQSLNYLDDALKVRSQLKFTIFGAMDRFYQILDLIPNEPDTTGKKNIAETASRNNDITHGEIPAVGASLLLPGLDIVAAASQDRIQV